MPPPADGKEVPQFGQPIHYLGLGLLAFYLYTTLGGGGNSGGKTHEISFQEFKTKLLGQVRVWFGRGVQTPVCWSWMMCMEDLPRAGAAQGCRGAGHEAAGT